MNLTTRLTPQTLLTPAVKKIFADAMLGNAWTSRTLQQIIRTGVDKYIPIYTPIDSVMGKSSNVNPGSRNHGSSVVNGI